MRPEAGHAWRPSLEPAHVNHAPSKSTSSRKPQAVPLLLTLHLAAAGARGRREHRSRSVEDHALSTAYAHRGPEGDIQLRLTRPNRWCTRRCLKDRAADCRAAGSGRDHSTISPSPCAMLAARGARSPDRRVVRQHCRSATSSRSIRSAKSQRLAELPVEARAGLQDRSATAKQ